MFTLDSLLRRAAASLLVIVGVVTLTFLAARLLPSDPARLHAGPRARPEQLAAIRTRLGLDRPLPKQFARYVAALAAGDWGDSFKTKRSVRADLALYLPATLELVIAGFALALAVGIPAGILASARPGGLFDRAGGLLAVLGASAPVFALALLAQQIFFNRLGWPPLNGRLSAEVSLAHPIAPLTGFYLVDAAVAGNWVAWRDALAHLILPALVVAVYPLCVTLRMTRACMADTLARPYIVAARAKGLPERAILLRHALRVAILPVLTVAGLAFAYAVTGSVLVELIFRWPGVGFYLTDAILSRDFPVIVAVTLVSTLIYVAVTLALDVLRGLLDPRG
jgi:peptide/nickel transport system permease protein